jgi:hypothetical protein
MLSKMFTDSSEKPKSDSKPRTKPKSDSKPKTKPKPPDVDPVGVDISAPLSTPFAYFSETGSPEPCFDALPWSAWSDSDSENEADVEEDVEEDGDDGDVEEDGDDGDVEEDGGNDNNGMSDDRYGISVTPSLTLAEDSPSSLVDDDRLVQTFFERARARPMIKKKPPPQKRLLRVLQEEPEDHIS